MPRHPKTAHATVSFSPGSPLGQKFRKQAEASGYVSLSAYLKVWVYALLAEWEVLLLKFTPGSLLLRHLTEEAQEMEMPLDTYVLALLKDRDRHLYQKKPSALWYSHQPEAEDEEEGQDDVNHEEALENIGHLLEQAGDFFDA